MVWRGSSRFATKLDGLRAAKGSYLCRDCRTLDQTKGLKRCGACGSRNLTFFPSKAELIRAGQLLLLQDTGAITSLRFHVRHPLVVEGVKIAVYTDDASYCDRALGRIVVEDTKPVGFMEEHAKLKIALFDAIHRKDGLSVTLVKVQS